MWLILHLIRLNLRNLSLLLVCLLLESGLLSYLLLCKVLLASGYCLLNKLLWLCILLLRLVCSKLLNVLDLNLLLLANLWLNALNSLLLLLLFKLLLLFSSSPCILFFPPFLLIVFRYALLDICLKLATHDWGKLGQLKSIILLPIFLSMFCYYLDDAFGLLRSETVYLGNEIIPLCQSHWLIRIRASSTR